MRHERCGHRSYVPPYDAAARSAAFPASSVAGWGFGSRRKGLTPSSLCPCAAQIKPFIRVANYTHLMPTRYALEVELKSVVTTDIVSGSQANPTARQNARKEVKKILEEKYNSSLKTGKNKWFFQKLRF